MRRNLAGLLLIASCARPEPRVAADSIAPVDTVVRRVIRLVRTPTMMQRVTPLIHPTRAGAALAEPLVIRVLDQRGLELGGVPVQWRLAGAGDGATLTVVNAVTDTLGLSRATFVAGNSADTQVVAASVDRVGQIDFKLQLPHGTMRLDASRGSLTVGDSAEIRATLHDLAGAPLTGGKPEWGSTDTLILSVREVAPGHAIARARAVGRAEVAAWTAGGKVQDRAPIAVRYRTERVAIPATWRIDSGTYAGAEIPIDAPAALGREAHEPAFWRRVRVGSRGETILGWKPDAYPLRIAFDRQRSNERVTPQDSAAFWAVADQLERDMGADLFTPATFERSRPEGTVSIEIGSQYAEGHTFVVWSQQGDAYDGVVTLRHASTTLSSSVVTHELVHLLGFGHTSRWPTIMHPVAGTATRATPQDVAYTQLALWLRRRQVESDALPALPPAP